MTRPRLRRMTPRELRGMLARLHGRLAGELARNPFVARPGGRWPEGDGGPDDAVPPRADEP